MLPIFPPRILAFTWFNRYEALFWALLALSSLLRLVYASVLPLDISGDEAYYWDWGRHPDSGYVSKPPLIAWLMAFIRTLGLDSAVGIRQFAALLATGGLVFVFYLGKSMFGPRTGFLAALLAAVTPATAALSLLLTIDVPLMFCWSGALLAFWKYLHGDGSRGGWGAVLSCFLGLGLLAKQTMLAFVPLALCYVLTLPGIRRRLLSVSLWLGAGVLLLLPTLWWNYQHGWLTFHHTAHHFQSTPFSLFQVLKNLGEFLGTQAVLLGPLTWVLLVTALVACIPMIAARDHRWRFLVFFGGLPLLAVTLMTLRQGINPNWPAPFYTALLILLVAWAEKIHPNVKKTRWFRHGVANSAIFSLALYILPYLPLNDPVLGKDIDILRRLRGWEEAAVAVQKLRESVPQWRDAFVLTASHRFHTSTLAFYLPDRPGVYRWSGERGAIETQYEVWGLPRHDPGAGAVFVLANNHQWPDLPAELKGRFNHLRPLGDIEVPLGRNRSRWYRVYHGIGWRPLVAKPNGLQDGR